MAQHPYDDDIDDIMASIMQGKPAVPAAVKEGSKKPAKRTSGTQNAPRQKKQTHAYSPPAPKKKPRPRAFVKATLLVATLVLMVGAGFFLWIGPLSAIFTPPSPFSPEVAEKVQAPLYYPAKLPGSYKIELGSITQPEPSVVVYAASDDSGNKLNFSLQKQPKGLNLNPLYEALSDIKEVETKFGTVKYGTLEDNLDIVNVLADSTWIIVTSSRGQLDEQDVQLLINSLVTG